jgi:hypothetical protein
MKFAEKVKVFWFFGSEKNTLHYVIVSTILNLASPLIILA